MTKKKRHDSEKAHTPGVSLMGNGQLVTEEEFAAIESAPLGEDETVPDEPSDEETAMLYEAADKDEDPASADSNGQTSLLGNGLEAPLEPLPSIDLPTPHHYRLTRTALEDRVTTIKALAKKLDDEDYIREARILTQDALALSEDVLPQFARQVELPLATADEVQSGIANELRGIVRSHVRRDNENVDHEALLLKWLSERIERYACDIAERAYAAGLAAREATAEVFAIKSLNALRKA